MKLKSILITLMVGITISMPNVMIHADDIDNPTAEHNQAGNWENNHHHPLMQSINRKHQITYQIKTKIPLYQTAYQQAIQQWNALNVIKLVSTKRNPQIQLKGNQMSPNDDDDGETDYGFADKVHHNGKFKYQYFNITIVKLNIDTRNTEPTQLLAYTTLVAEHELGHALGFGHDDTLDNNHVRVMNSHFNYTDTNIVNPVGAYEQQTLYHYYQYQLNKRT